MRSAELSLISKKHIRIQFMDPTSAEKTIKCVGYNDTLYWKHPSRNISCNVCDETKNIQYMFRWIESKTLWVCHTCIQTGKYREKQEMISMWEAWEESTKKKTRKAHTSIGVCV